MNALLCCCSQLKILLYGLRRLRHSSWISFAYVKHLVKFIEVVCLGCTCVYLKLRINVQCTYKSLLFTFFLIRILADDFEFNVQQFVPVSLLPLTCYIACMMLCDKTETL